MRQFTQKDIAQFERDGFIVVDQILRKEEVAAVSAAGNRIDRGEYTNDRRPPTLRKRIDHLGRGASIRWYLNARILDGELWEVTTDTSLGAMAATLLRTQSVSLLEDQLLDKPGPGLPCNFHQDYGYWLFSTSTQMISCWVALTDMRLEMGPLQLIPGSHDWGWMSNPTELIAGSAQAWLEAVERARPVGHTLAPFVTACVPAGGGVFFHSLTFHGSASNRTRACRRAFSMHWAGAQCRVDRTKLARYTYPYFFAGILHGGRVVNKYMPIVYSRSSIEIGRG
jgi:ectoine hydroxylase-related dioxygenase (phytanoyl-CoA dioxygenase family)